MVFSQYLKKNTLIASSTDGWRVVSEGARSAPNCRQRRLSYYSVKREGSNPLSSP